MHRGRSSRPQSRASHVSTKKGRRVASRDSWYADNSIGIPAPTTTSNVPSSSYPVAKTSKPVGAATPVQPQEMKPLDEQSWYHGLCSREDAEKLLTEPGHFVVRASESMGKVTIVLSLFAGKRKVHLTIDTTNQGTFYLKAMKGKERQFVTVYGLIRYYMNHRIRLRSGGATIYYRLREGVPRPKWHVMSEWIIYDQNANPIGQGHFAQVFVGVFRPNGVAGPGEITVAIKVCKAMSGSEGEQRAKQEMIREGKVMSYYDHQNVVKFYGVACDRPQQVILVIEYCPGGSLDRHLIMQKMKILIAERITFSVEAALGMRYLHQQGCLHRDLAARNCLISADGVLKIADFGLSFMQGVTEREKVGNMPIRWMAPETLVRNPFFSTKSDVWSYGMLLFEIFNMGVLPWPSVDNKRIATAIRHGEMPPLPVMTPVPVKELIGSIWVLACEDRPGFREIVQKLRIIRESDSAFRIHDMAHCTVNRLPNVHRTEAIETAIMKQTECDIPEVPELF